MSNVIASRKILAATAGRLHSLNAALRVGAAAAAAPTTRRQPVWFRPPPTWCPS